MSAAVERQLLFGLLALQNGFITRDQLVFAFSVWSQDKNRPLDSILESQGVIDAAKQTFLASLVEQHVPPFDGDPTVDPVAPHADQEDPEVTKVHKAGRTSEAGSRFEKKRLHAKGGLGQVSIALDHELHREVALKEIQRKYADEEEFRLRFLCEAEITGGLEHPGIVPVYSLGSDSKGRPYYAMKLIKGDSLRDALKRFHLLRDEKKASFDSSDFRRLLKQFIDVCNAIQYAHDRGVLHRDLKPANIMLGPYGETLVVDWGLAKPVGEKRPEAGLAGSGEKPLILHAGSSGTGDKTLRGRPYGTPQFMSPEQARGETDQLTSATDVYSLGATLYQILTGTPPAQDTDPTIINEKQKSPVDPPRDLAPHAPQPLKAICRKAMALAPEDRYPGPLALAKEIEHWLADEPIEVAPDRPLQRIARFTRKNRGVVATAMAALLLIAVGTAFAYTQEAQLRRKLAISLKSEMIAKQEAITQQQRAEAGEKSAQENARLAKVNEERAVAAGQLALANAALAKTNETRALGAERAATDSANVARKQAQLALETLKSVVFDMQQSLKTTAGTLPVRRRLLQTVSTRLERIATEYIQVEVKDRLGASTLQETADVLLRLGEADKGLEDSAFVAAQRLYQQAHQIFTQLAASTPTDIQAQRDLSISYNKLANMELHAGRLDLARESYQQARQIRERLVAENSKDHQSQHDLFNSYHKLGDLEFQAGSLSAAQKLYEQGLEISQELAKTDWKDAQRDLAISFSKLGELSQQSGDLLKTQSFYEQALQMFLQLAKTHPDDIAAQRDLATIYERLGEVALFANNLPGAQEFYDQRLELGQQLVKDSPEDIQAQRDLAIAYDKVGDVAVLAGDLPGAQASYDQGLQIRQPLADAAPEDARAQRDLAISYHNLGDVAAHLNDPPRARELYEDSREIRQSLAEAAPEDAQAQRDLSISYERLGDVTLLEGDPTAAWNFHDQVLKIRQRLAEASPNDSQAQRDLMLGHYKLGEVELNARFNFEAAAADYQRGLSVLEAFAAKTGQKPLDADLETLQQRLALCDATAKNILDLASLEAQPADDLPAMLIYRGQVLTFYASQPAAGVPAAVREKWGGGTWRLAVLEEVTQTAAALMKRADGNATTSYYAGCVYGLALNTLKKVAEDPAQKAELGDEAAVTAQRQKWTTLALESLTAAITAGYDKADEMAQAPELEQLRDHSEFQALLKQIRDKASGK